MSAEFVSISSSSFDPAALAAQLTEHAAQGWSVVSIVPTGGDVTAFLTREAVAGEFDAPAEQAVDATIEAPVEAAAVAAAVAEPAGWAVAPDPAPLAPIAQATPPAYTPAPSYAPAPAPAYNPAPAVPSGWYADPAGRFELRYWDGGAWTEHVSRSGQQFTDAPVA